MQVIAIIGDIVESRAIAKRTVFQRNLSLTLAKTGSVASGLASPFTLTLGDEFQAVYRAPGTIWADLLDILVAIYPARARLALGVGKLSTALNPAQALGMDGPAFHQARAKLGELKEDGINLGIAGEEGTDWALANQALGYISHHLEGWGANRLRILAGLLREKSARELGTKLGISRVAVYKNINAAALDQVVGICQELTRSLEQALRQP